MQRLFVSIDLPQAVKRELAGICLGLPGARWVADKQIHLTLRFIGEVDGGILKNLSLSGVRALYEQGEFGTVGNY